MATHQDPGWHRRFLEETDTSKKINTALERYKEGDRRPFILETINEACSTGDEVTRRRIAKVMESSSAYYE